MRIGLVSDTHDLLRPEVADYLQGSDRIVHAGDICSAAVLEALAAIAPVTAVRGNNDRGDWASGLSATADLHLEGLRLHVIHDLAHLSLDPRGENIAVVVSGHSHKPGAEERDGVLYVNPGSAGPRRFKLPISAAELHVHEGRVSVHFRRFDP